MSRTLDASYNRAVEGMRALMDLVRFELNSEPFSESLKSLRHDLTRALLPEGRRAIPLIEARNSREDVSRPDPASAPPPVYRDALDLFLANFSRVQQSLRSIEEFLRLSDPAVAREVEYLRYRAYDLEKEMLPLVEALSNRKLMDFELYVVTNRKIARDRDMEILVRDAIRGGAGCIQLREKEADARTLLALGKSLRKVTRDEGATFIINDRLDIALETEADGVHLGQEDLPLDAARKFSAGRLLIGISTHNPAQALEAQTGGAGYVNLGPVFPTMTKGVPVVPVGTELIRQMVPQLKIPFTTMGGIHLENVEEVILAGADRVAVVSEVMAAENVREAARKMLDAVHRAKQKRGAAS